MKILHIASSYYPAFKMGGPIESVHLLNKTLVQKGVDITVYTTNAGIEKPIEFNKETLIDNVKVFYFSYFGYTNFTFSLSLFWSIRKNIKNFDLIHITGIWNFPVLAATFLAKFYRKPYVVSPRGSLMNESLKMKSLFIKKLFLFLFVRRYLRSADSLHFTVEKEKDEYLKLGLPAGKISIIPNSVDLSRNFGVVLKNNFREKFKISKDKKIVLFVGRLHKIKGLDTLIPAFAEVVKKDSKAVLVLVGSDENNYKKEIERFIEIEKLKDKVLFTGILIGNDKISAYQESNIFVLPSYSENFGMVVVEAMANGLPVVITKNVGISDEVKKAKSGIVVEKDVNQISEAILKILNNLELAQKMSKAGEELSKIEFSNEKVAEKWIKEYNKILNNYEKH